MEILQEVWSAHDSLPIPLREARAIALASALEPLSEKPGCVTRRSDTNKNTLEMFLSAAVNIFPTYFQLASYVYDQGSSKGMYRFFPQAVAMSKCQRLGGQINLGIIEFSFPIVAAHILAQESPIEKVFERAQKVVDESDASDFQYFWEGKKIAQEITRLGRGKTYSLVEYANLESIKSYYERELARERTAGTNSTGIQHNRQFVEGFSGIAETFQYFQQARGTISARSSEAYNKIIAKSEYNGKGEGLVADFIAMSLYLEICHKRELFIG